MEEFEQEDSHSAFQEFEVELCLRRLRNAMDMFTHRIQERQAEMRVFRSIDRHSADEFARKIARRDYAQARCRVLQLSRDFLNELMDMAMVDDRRCLSLWQMLTGNCHWLLAKFYSSPDQQDQQDHHFRAAIACYERIFDLVEHRLPCFNQFYLFLVHRLSQLAIDSHDRCAQMMVLRSVHCLRTELSLATSYVPKEVRRQLDEIERLTVKFEHPRRY